MRLFSVSLPSRTEQVMLGLKVPSKSIHATEPVNLWFVWTKALKSDGKGAPPLALAWPQAQSEVGGAVGQALVLENQC